MWVTCKYEISARTKIAYYVIDYLLEPLFGSQMLLNKTFMEWCCLIECHSLATRITFDKGLILCIQRLN